METIKTTQVMPGEGVGRGRVQVESVLRMISVQNFFFSFIKSVGNTSKDNSCHREMLVDLYLVSWSCVL